MSLLDWRRLLPNHRDVVDSPGRNGHRLRPLDGLEGLVVLPDATLLVESPRGPQIPLVWSLYAHNGWYRLADLEARRDRVGVATEVVCTAVTDGEVRFAVGVGVAGGAPVGVVEVTNSTSSPVAIGVDADTGSPTRIDDNTYWCGQRPLLTSELGRRPAPAGQPIDGEPELIVALPHSATARFAVPLGDDAPWIATTSRPAAAVPTLDDIERGWQRHLSRGMRVGVEGEDRWAQSVNPLLHRILTAPPAETHLDEVTAAAQFGFSLPAGHVLAAVEADQVEPAAVLTAVGTWDRLDDPATVASEAITERLVVAVAKAAHTLCRSSQPTSALGAGARPIGQLTRAMRAVEQPEVADRIGRLADRFDASGPETPHPSVSTLQTWLSSARGANPNPAEPGTGAAYLVGLRQRFVDSRSLGVVGLLADLSPTWRGRAIDVFDAPVGDAKLSYGLRWHGPRPAMLWNVEPQADPTPLTLQMPAIDRAWSTEELAGEALLADPGWIKR